MAKKKKKKKLEPHPTLFVWDGSIKHFEHGSMLELHAQITDEEWQQVVEQTVLYKVFLECLKSTACPILEEPWLDEDDWFRVQLDISVSRMRNIDPLLVGKHDQEKLTKLYVDKMRKNAQEVRNLVIQMRDERQAIADSGGHNGITSVSNL
jgi:hypothetical protein